MDRYLDRREAGKLLATFLLDYANRKDVIVLALPRGGVPVADEVAQALNVPLDIFIVRKLGVPGHEELAMGAIATGNVHVFNEDVLNELSVTKQDIDQVIDAEREEMARREKLYRGKRPFPNLTNNHIILIDDGIATGATIRAAIKALRQFKPAEIIVGVPVAEKSTCAQIGKLADKIICPLQPTFFYAVGAWYDDFNQTTDREVSEILASYGEKT